MNNVWMAVICLVAISFMFGTWYGTRNAVKKYKKIQRRRGVYPFVMEEKARTIHRCAYAYFLFLRDDPGMTRDKWERELPLFEFVDGHYSKRRTDSLRIKLIAPLVRLEFEDEGAAVSIDSGYAAGILPRPRLVTR